MEPSTGKGTPVLKRMTPVALSLAIIFAVTVILFYLKDAFQGAQHLIFFYLVPTAFVAMIYGSVLAMFFAIVATSVAAFFLYAPIYSFYVSDPREVGELILFAVIGLIGAKCVAELRRPPSESFHRGSPLVK
jgi:two-component system, OmpR family, sensor histidine kinase KdpD